MRRTEPERLDILQAHREHVLEHLAEVQGHLMAIDGKIDYYKALVHDEEKRNA